MTLEQCNHCIKINKQRRYCAYYKKYISKIESCERIIEYKMPQCPEHNCSMDMQNLGAIKTKIEYKCLFCDLSVDVHLSKEYTDYA
jgi:hypothetical protein